MAFADFWPEDDILFGLWLTVHIGPESEEGAHQFQFLVCTPDWIKEKCSQSGFLWGRHMLIMLAYDHARIVEEIGSYVAGCTGNDFWAVAQKIARVGAWEYEDYQS